MRKKFVYRTLLITRCYSNDFPRSKRALFRLNAQQHKAAHELSRAKGYVCGPRFYLGAHSKGIYAVLFEHEEFEIAEVIRAWK